MRFCSSIHPDHQDRGLDRIELLERTIDERLQRRGDRILRPSRRCQQFGEMLAIGARGVLALEELRA